MKLSVQLHECYTFVVLESLAQNLLSINCLLCLLDSLFYRFWFSSYRTRDFEVEVAHTIKAPPFWYNFGCTSKWHVQDYPFCWGSWTLWTCIILDSHAKMAYICLSIMLSSFGMDMVIERCGYAQQGLAMGMVNHYHNLCYLC